MDDKHPDGVTRASDDGSRTADRHEFARIILHSVNRDLTRTDFLHAASQGLMTCTGCDAVELRLHDAGLHYRWTAAWRPKPTARFEPVHWRRGPNGTVIPALDQATDLEHLCAAVACRQVDAALPCFTEGGSFWTADVSEDRALTVAARIPRSQAVAARLGSERPEQGAEPEARSGRLRVRGPYRSLAIVRFLVGEDTVGLLLFRSRRPNAFTPEHVTEFEHLAQTLGLAVAGWSAHNALRERAKELTCLYGIAERAERADAPLQEMLHTIAELLPPAWPDPPRTAARIVIDGRAHATAGFRVGPDPQSAAVIVHGRPRGVVEVHALDARPEFTVETFRKDKEMLLAVAARTVAQLVARKEAEDEHRRLQPQRIYTDRLATIGQLAAELTHELNEPLGSILGFAQLAGKCPGLPEEAARDLKQIVASALHARAVMKNWPALARLEPPQRTRLNLNQVVEESLRLLAPRCTHAGARVVHDPAAALPDIHGDPAQLTQVLINLVVNAVQAMPPGGTLTVRTRGDDAGVSLVVEDTGRGMDEEVLGRIFQPFFTTKGANEGTGLGLPVVHDIVSAHGGTMEIQSRPGQGTRLEIRLPVADVT